MSGAATIVISIVIPVYRNGAAMVRDCHRALASAVAAFADPVEIVFVDDGSRDGTLPELIRLQQEDPRVRVVELAANFGQHAAYSAGFEAARGDFVVTLDVDLQADPADIPRMIAPLRQGFDLVSGVRLDRTGPLARRLASRVVTRLVASMTGVKLRDIGCPFNAFSADVAKRLAAFGELRRFLKPLAVRVAQRVTEVEVAYHPRRSGYPSSGYSATRLVRLFMDFFINSVTDLFAWVFVVGAAVAGLLALAAILLGIDAVAGGAAGAAAVSCALLAVWSALVSLFGLAGDYVQRIYRQSSGRPFYLVRHVYETPDGSAHGQ